jgi:hypothetical protein
MLISTALLLDSNIRNSVCTPAKFAVPMLVGSNPTEEGGWMCVYVYAVPPGGGGIVVNYI